MVRRDEAIRRGWLHRIATTVCLDEQGRFLVHRRGDALVRFPGYHQVTIDVGAFEPEVRDRRAGRSPRQRPSRVAPHEACVPDPGQVRILLAHCPEAIRDLVTALPATGLRLGELLGLRVSDV